MQTDTHIHVYSGTLAVCMLICVCLCVCVCVCVSVSVCVCVGGHIKILLAFNVIDVGRIMLAVSCDILRIRYS